MVFLHSLSLAPRSTYSPFSSTIVPLFSIKQLSNFQSPKKLNSFVGEQWHSLPILLRSFATPVSVPRSTQNESDSSPLSPISIVTFHTLSNVFHNFLKNFSQPRPHHMKNGRNLIRPSLAAPSVEPPLQSLLGAPSTEELCSAFSL